MGRLISVLLALVIGAVAGIAVAAPALQEQSSMDAGVGIAVTPRALTGATWTFDVVLVTHSGSLDDDLAKEAVLIADGGAARPAVAWQGTSPGGHHRKGVLSFQAPSEMPSALEVRIQRPGENAARVFRWNLK